MNYIGFLDIAQDMLALVCGIMLLRAVGEYRERNRIASVITFIVSFAVSVAVSRLFKLWSIEQTGTLEEYLALEALIEYALSVVEMVIWIGAPLIVLRVTQKLKGALLLFALMSISELPSGLLSIIIADISVNEQLVELMKEISVVLSYVVFCALLIGYSRRNKLSVIKNVFETVPDWLYFLAFSISLFAHFVGESEVITLKNIVVVATTIGVVFAIVYLMKNVSLLTLKQNEILSRLDEQQVGYEKMLKSDEQLREFRHDYKNHMLVVTALLNAGKTDEAADYLEKVKVKSGIVGRQFSTGNFVVDAILNNKNSLAEEFEIHIGFSGVVPTAGVENADLCTVVANLLDNAIEGTKRYVGNRYINITASVRNGYLAFSVANPVNSKVEIKGNRIKTTKQDSKNHGIGLRNVQNTAEKYGGTMLLDCSDTEFTADVNMKLDHQ